MGGEDGGRGEQGEIAKVLLDKGALLPPSFQEWSPKLQGQGVLDSSFLHPRPPNLTSHKFCRFYLLNSSSNLLHFSVSQTHHSQVIASSPTWTTAMGSSLVLWPHFPHPSNPQTRRIFLEHKCDQDPIPTSTPSLPRSPMPSDKAPGSLPGIQGPQRPNPTHPDPDLADSPPPGGLPGSHRLGLEVPLWGSQSA